MVSRRFERSSKCSGAIPRAAAQTTIFPADHDTWRATASNRGSLSITGLSAPPPSATAATSGPRSPAAVTRRLSSVSVRSATTSARSSAGSDWTDDRLRSISRISWSRTLGACSSARSNAASASVPRPLANDQIAASSSNESVIEFVKAAGRRDPRSIRIFSARSLGYEPDGPNELIPQRSVSPQGSPTTCAVTQSGLRRGWSALAWPAVTSGEVEPDRDEIDETDKNSADVFGGPDERTAGPLAIVLLFGGAAAVIAGLTSLVPGWVLVAGIVVFCLGGVLPLLSFWRRGVAARRS